MQNSDHTQPIPDTHHSPRDVSPIARASKVLGEYQDLGLNLYYQKWRDGVDNVVASVEDVAQIFPHAADSTGVYQQSVRKRETVVVPGSRITK